MVTARDAAACRCRSACRLPGRSLAEPQDGDPEGITGSEQSDIGSARNRLVFVYPLRHGIGKRPIVLVIAEPPPANSPSNDEAMTQVAQ